MRTTRKAILRTLGASIVVIISLTAACEREMAAPDGADRPQTGGTPYVRRVRVIEPGELGITDPTGLAFSPRAGRLVVGTSAPGTPPDAATGIELVSLAELPLGTVQNAAGVPDPVNMAFDGRANRLLILHSASSELIAIPAGPDGDLDPQALTRIAAPSLGVRDAQGLTVDPATGRFFILDAAGPRIVRVDPDTRLGFENPTVSAIDLAQTGWSRLRGLAFDPTTGHLHVMDPAAQALYELSETGRLVATRNVGRFGIRGTQGMTFAPSGDATDDPAEQSLYIADGGQISEMSFVQSQAVVAAPAVTGTLIRTIATSRFSPPGPDPSGITYVNHLDRLVIADGEVDEMSIYNGANLFEMSRSGSLADKYTTTAFSYEPVGITYDPANRHLFIADDDRKKVFEVDPRSDGRYRTSDDIVRSFSTSSFGNGDPEGVTIDFVQRVLYLADGINSEVYRLAPGPNGIFEGVGSGRDDAASSFDTERLGLTDPEGIAYDSDSGHLYIVGVPDHLVFHVTSNGTLLRTINISAAGPVKPGGLAYGPSSADPSKMSLWIVDRGVDNDSNPNENDGRVFEFAVPPLSGNTPPTVTVTAPANGSSIAEGTSITFTGTATDAEDGNLTASLSWTSSLDGTIGSGGSFSRTLSVGTHTITARVTDLSGQQSSATITVIVNPGSTGGAGTLNVRVAASSDDAEESSSGGMSLTSSDLELVFDGSNQTVGLRFNGVTIPRGAVVTNAYVQFQVDEARTGATSLTIRGQASDNASTFTTATANISSRSKTTSFATWTPVAWPTVGAAGTDQRTPNIAGIIQEIVNRAGWSSGNSLAIVVTGTGVRLAEAYNGVPSAAPLLHVEFSDGSGDPNAAPTASNVTTVGTAQVGQTLTGNYTYGDVDGDAEGTSTYRWLRNGSPISGATARTYNLLSADQGAMIAFEVQPVASTGTSPGTAVQSAAVGPVAAPPTANSAPTASNVMITGMAQAGQTLTGNYTYGDVNGDAEGSSTYRWLRNASPISGATARTYNLVTADQGAMMTFEVTPVAATGASPGTAVQSSAAGPVAAPPTAGADTLNVRVAASSDDAEESSSGGMSLTSSDLELVFYGSGNNQTVGMRFNGVTIPTGAVVTNAYVQFQVDEATTGATSLTIRGQASDNASTFTTSTANISSRSKTTSFATWTPVAWPTVGAAGADQRTPNIAAIIQEIVNRAGWSSGNSLVIVVTGTGLRNAKAYNGNPSAAPLLHVEFSVGSGDPNADPTASSVAITGTAQAGQTLTRE